MDVEQLPEIWTLEERALTSPAALQAHVRQDLRRIESGPLWPSPFLKFIYKEAARILNDSRLVDDLRDRVLREAPHSGLAHMLMGGEHEPDPASLKDLTEIDRSMESASLSPDAVVMWPPLETMVARHYVDARIRLDQVPRLLDAGFTKIEKQEKYRISDELIPIEMRSHMMDSRHLTWEKSEMIRADYLLLMKRPADARAVVERAMIELETKPSKDDQAKDRAGFLRREWLRRLGDADAEEGKVGDALLLYRESLAGSTKEWLAHVSEHGTTAEIKQYYLAHGGTDEKWPEWATTGTAGGTAPAVPSEPQFQFPMRDFSAKDLSGRVWSLRDLRGKVTFVDLWATWCGPCVAEHAAIQRLFDSLGTRPKAQLLTISVDNDRAAVEGYMKKSRYTFPVINAPDLADKMIPYIGLPTSFLVNTNAQRTGIYPFGSQPSFVERLERDMDSAAK
jgi:thiol-disulfide isomerase/thioredoxin